MDSAPAEGNASGAQIHPLLRQRMLNRAATFAEGTSSSAPPLSRRRSSVLSDLSDTRHSFRSSTENLQRGKGNDEMDLRASADEPTNWISIPIVAAIVPAVVGLTHDNGAAVATDMLLLVLASWFLHWCIRVPWDWYHEAQQRRYEYGDISANQYDDTILEEEEDSIANPQEAKSTDSKDNSDQVTNEQSSARDELKREESTAFIACFLGPLLGALLLHTIRAQLTRAEGIVSNFNLGIFFLGAEIRPFRHLIKMKKEKIWHLQRIVRLDPRDELRSANAQQISQRLAELETRMEGSVTSSEVDISRVSAEVRQSIQLQLDALNRAVRRYEKRQMAQTLQVEARFQEVDMRLKDTLTLAAAAARTGQRPGILSVTISWIASVINYFLQTIWDIATYPIRAVGVIMRVVKSWFVKDERQSRRRGKGNGHSSLSTSRMQSKSGR
ncbi:hypothetical protein IQ07DRAFT_620771 [Pyrenochaeta sp. DS3sAY3a]|nr:hypothetical protein IQ07DRAFT_620771 [Pyrenochaeta sp. DS3sAY3a]